MLEEDVGSCLGVVEIFPWHDVAIGWLSHTLSLFCSTIRVSAGCPKLSHPSMLRLDSFRGSLPLQHPVLSAPAKFRLVQDPVLAVVPLVLDESEEEDSPETKQAIARARSRLDRVACRTLSPSLRRSQ